jgi:hypothetical protein
MKSESIDVTRSELAWHAARLIARQLVRGANIVTYGFTQSSP